MTKEPRVAQIRLDKLTDKELSQLIRSAETELRRRAIDAKKAALKQLSSVAKDFGFSLNDLLGGEAPRRGRPPVVTQDTKREKLPPKYRNPANAMQTWSGHGKRPTWAREHIESGGDLADLLIKKPRGRAAAKTQNVIPAKAPVRKPQAAEPLAQKRSTTASKAKPKAVRRKAAAAKTATVAE
jgi:DNA-binding protein H-NS